jgi:hypothetical protein
MIVLYRLMLMIAGYVAACVAASLVLTLGSAAPEWGDINQITNSPDLQSIALWAVAIVGAAIIFAIAMLPALLVIAITEVFALRSVVVYGAIGAALALATAYGLNSYGFDAGGPAAQSGGDFAHEREVIAAAGIAGGLVYWLFAGRKAGAWSSGRRA